MEEQVIQFVEEISESRIMTSNEMLDMRITLLEEMNRSVSPQNSSMFLKSLREKMNSSDNSIFTENGLNIEAVKSLVTTVAKDVEKKIELNIENEQKIDEENKKIINEIFSEDIKKEETNKEPEKEDKIDWSDKVGYKLEVTQEEIDETIEVLTFLNDGKAPTEKETQEYIEAEEFYARINELMKTKGLSYDEASVEYFISIGIDPTSERAKNIENENRDDVLAVHVPLIIYKQFEKLQKTNPNATLLDLDPEELVKFIMTEYPAYMLEEDFLRDAVNDILHEMPDINPSSQQKEEAKTEKQEQEEKTEKAESKEEESPSTSRRPGKVTEKTFPMINIMKRIIKERTAGKKTDKIGSLCQKKEKSLTDLKRAQNRAQILEKTFASPEYVVNAQRNVDVERTNYIKTLRTYELEKAKANEDELKIYNQAVDRKNSIVNDIVERYFKEDKDLVTLYKELGEDILNKNNIIFEDITKVLEQRLNSNMYSNLFIVPISKSEGRIYANTMELETLENYKAKLLKEANISEVIEFLADIEKKIDRLKDKIDKDREEAKVAKAKYIETPDHKKKADNYDKEQKNDYIDVVKESKNPRNLSDYIEYENKIIRDRNTIKKIAVKNSLSEEEAAKQYFKNKPEHLKKYSKQFQALFNNEDNNSKFNIDILDNIIKYHNSQIKEEIHNELLNDEVSYQNLLKEKTDGDMLIDMRVRMQEYKAQMVKSDNLTKVMGEDKHKYIKERESHFNTLIEMYFSSKKSVYQLMQEAEKMGITDVDQNELLSRIVKKVEEKVPGEGTNIYNLEMELEQQQLRKAVYQDLVMNSLESMQYEEKWYGEIDDADTIIQMSTDNVSLIKQKYMEKNNEKDNREVEQEADELAVGARFRNMNPLDVSKIFRKTNVTSQELSEQIGILLEVGKDEQDVTKENPTDRTF